MPGGDSQRGADASDSSSASRGQSGEGEQTASSSSAGVDATGESSDDISFEEPAEAGSTAASGQQSDGGDLSVDAAVDDKVLQEAFEVLARRVRRHPGNRMAAQDRPTAAQQRAVLLLPAVVLQPIELAS